MGWNVLVGVASAVTLIVSWVSPLPAAEVASDRLRDYAVLGLERVTVRSGVSVTGGDVGCNAESCTVSLRSRVVVGGAVAGTTLRVGRRIAALDFFCTAMDPLATNVRAEACSPVEPPLVEPNALPAVEVTPGSEDVRLKTRAVAEAALPPGAYRSVRVGNGAKLTLAGGDYDLRSLWVGKRSELLCEAPCTVRVAKRTVIREAAVVGAVAPLDGRDVRLEVQGAFGKRAALRAYRRATIDARLYVPNGALTLGMNGRYRGSFVAKRILVYERSQIEGPGAYLPRPPAEPAP
jgi:hypothetical protein